MPEPAPWPAPAKLNLFLHVTGRRQNGYHELQTVLQLLDWGDEVMIEVTPEPDIRRTLGIAGVPVERDLAIRAAHLLRSRCGVQQGARIGISKRIPAGAGLGGASSDAATVLLALNALWGCGLDPSELAVIGLELGADVPLFVHGRSAWAGGVGERLRPVALGERHYVLVLPDCHVSTAEVFADPALRRDTPAIGGDDWDYNSTHNDCEAVVRRRWPTLDRLALELREWGPVRMSGTGGAFFITVADGGESERVTTALKSRYNVRAVRGVDASPLLDRLAGSAASG